MRAVGSEAVRRRAGRREVVGIDDDEEALAAGEDVAVWELEGDGVEELAAGGAFPAEVARGEGEWGVEGCGAEVVDLEVAGHGEDVEGAVELAHGLVEEGGDDAAVDVAGRALMELGEVDEGGCDGVFGVRGV